MPSVWPITAVFALACTGVAYAITLDEAVNRALAENLDLRAAYYNLEIGRGKLIQAGLWPNPELELTGSTDSPFTNESQRGFVVGFTQAFPISGRLRKAQEVSRVDLAQAFMEIRNQERILIGEVQKDFLTALVLQRQIAIRNDVKKTNQQFLKISEARREKAEVSDVDVNLAKAEVERLNLENDLASAALDARLVTLRQRLGLTPSAPLTLEGDLDSLLGGLAPKPASAYSAAERPDLRQTELGIDRARAEVVLARAEAWADWRIGLDFTDDTAIDEPEGLSTDRFIGIKFSIPLPLWNRNQGRVYEQQAAGSQALQQVQALELTIRAEIAAAIARASKVRDAAQVYRTRLVPLYEQNVVLLKDGYSQGVAEFSQIINTQNQQSLARLSYFDALMLYAEALVDLETVAAANPHLKKDFLQKRPLAKAKKTQKLIP